MYLRSFATPPQMLRKDKENKFSRYINDYYERNWPQSVILIFINIFLYSSTLYFEWGKLRLLKRKT